ncbi:MAG: DHH family phosphoesterase [Deltaproteobacteria bacterium]|nr:DHH family phosphoesterase [Deltaproteobacteria bacterium]
MPTAKRAQGNGPYCRLPSAALTTTGLARWAPRRIVTAVLEKGSCLIVGDRPGDPDCFISAGCLAALRRDRGLEADAYVDAPTESRSKRVLGRFRLAAEAEVSSKHYDTVILVDNAESSVERIGALAREKLMCAKRVIVIDHHETRPTRSSLGLSEGTELFVWREPRADATALMVASIILQAFSLHEVEVERSLWPEGWALPVRARALLWPLLAAIYSDTRGYQNAGPRSIHLVRHLVAQSHEIDRKPRRIARQEAGRFFRIFDTPVPESVRRWLVAQCSESSENWSGWSVGVFQVPGTSLLEAWSAARRRRPTVTWSELLFLVLDHFELRVREAGFDLGLFVIETSRADRSALDADLVKHLPSRPVRISIRSLRDDVATGLAEALGGHGKRGQAGCTTEESIEEVLTRARSWVAEALGVRNNRRAS